LDFDFRNKNLKFPKEIKEARAITCGFGAEIGTTGVCRGFLTVTGSNQTWTSPSDWNNSNNTIEAIGAGGSGGGRAKSSSEVATGGGGGAYSLISNFVIADPGTTQATYRIGAGSAGVSTTGVAQGVAGEDTWFNNSTFPGSGTNNTYCAAKGGSGGAAGAQPQNGGAGGADTAGWGETRRSGGSGGNVSHNSNATGGGGTAGNSSTGGNGINSSTDSSATDGGQANGSGAAGGAANTNGSGNAGGAGTEYTTEGSGGGGGGGRVSANTSIYGGNGGSRGGGGGGAVNFRPNGAPRAVGGSGADGIIVITYTPPATTTITNGASEPSSITIGPGGSITDLDNFTLQTSAGTDTVTAATVTLGPANAYTNIAQVDITNTSNIAQCTAVTNPSSNTVVFSTCSIPATTTETTFKVRITPKIHTSMPAVPGASYATTGWVTSFTTTNTQSGSDTGSATITVDNLSPNGATSTSGSAGNTQVTLNWTTSSSSDFDDSIILRWAASTPGAEVPAEGGTYSVDNTITTATVACVKTADAASTGVSGVDGAGTGGCSAVALTNDQAYAYKAFQKDSNGNYDAGVTFTGSPFSPVASATLTFSISANSINFGTLNISNPRFATTTSGSDSETVAHSLAASTNSSGGYSITARGGTLTSGVNTISAIGGTASDVSAGGGSEQFGIRLTASGGSGAAVAPYNGAVNMYAYAITASTEDEVASSSGASTETTFSVYYAANISALTDAGTYETTLTYICTGNF